MQGLDGDVNDCSLSVIVYLYSHPLSPCRGSELCCWRRLHDTQGVIINMKQGNAQGVTGQGACCVVLIVPLTTAPSKQRWMKEGQTGRRGWEHAQHLPIIPSPPVFNAWVLPGTAREESKCPSLSSMSDVSPLVATSESGIIPCFYGKQRQCFRACCSEREGLSSGLAQDTLNKQLLQSFH